MRRTRLEAGIGLRELARRVGICRTYLSRIEGDVDKHKPYEPVIKKIALELGADADELLLLAGRTPGDVFAVLKRDPSMLQFIRAAWMDGLSGHELLALLSEKKRI